MECPSHIVPVFVGDAKKAQLCMDILLDKYKIYVQVTAYLLKYKYFPNDPCGIQ